MWRAGHGPPATRVSASSAHTAAARLEAAESTARRASRADAGPDSARPRGAAPRPVGVAARVPPNTDVRSPRAAEALSRPRVRVLPSQRGERRRAPRGWPPERRGILTPARPAQRELCRATKGIRVFPSQRGEQRRAPQGWPPGCRRIPTPACPAHQWLVARRRDSGLAAPAVSGGLGHCTLPSTYSRATSHRPACLPDPIRPAPARCAPDPTRPRHRDASGPCVGRPWRRRVTASSPQQRGTPAGRFGDSGGGRWEHS